MSTLALIAALVLATVGAVIWTRGAGRRCGVYIIPSRSSLRHPAYIGHGYDPEGERLPEHDKKPWSWDIDRSRKPRIEWYPNKEIAHRRERELIRRLDPLYNEIRYKG